MAVSPTSAQRARNHYQTQKDNSEAAVAAALIGLRRTVQTRDTRDLNGIVAAHQLLAAELAIAALAEEADSDPYAIPAAFMGYTAEGFPLDRYLDAVVDQMAAALDDAAVFDDIVWQMEQVVASEVADAGRSAAGVEINMGPLWTNYVRLLNPPSCPRCVILAGRIYRDNEGFERHPNCDCVHWPVTSWEEAHDAGLVSSPGEAFEKGLITGLSAADTQAIEDGADMTAVINAHRGMSTAGVFKITPPTIAWSRANPNLPFRLRPETIYLIAEDQADVVRLLKLYGYIH